LVFSPSRLLKIFSNGDATSAARIATTIPTPRRAGDSRAMTFQKASKMNLLYYSLKVDDNPEADHGRQALSKVTADE
jgi:hypothetical protein